MELTASLPNLSRPDDLREKLRSYWRRRATFFIVASLLLLVAVLLSVCLPSTYQSSATILIEQQEIPQDLVRSAITSFADQRIQVISQRVMTTQNLLSLIDRYTLYPDIRQSKPREVLLQRMRDDIGLHMISAQVIDPRSGSPTHATIAFNVSYQNHSPDLALKVANDLTTLYLNENLTSRAQSAQQTSTFFADEATAQQARIDEIDKKVAIFKKQNRAKLPELNQLNVNTTDRTESELRDVDNRISSIDSQRLLLEAQLAQINPTSQVYSDTGQRVMSTEDRLKALKSQLAGFKAKYAPGHPDIISTEREVAGLEKEVKSGDETSNIARELTAAKSRLALAQQRYTAEHPDVIKAQHEVEDLEKKLAAQPARTTRDKEAEHADNPPYLQVKGQIDALSVERRAAEARRDALEAKLSDYESRLSGAPAVERDYRQLLRDLDNAQAKYQQLRAKQYEVNTSQDLETERKGERFTMIEPPLPPEKPISPNRILILAMGIVLSLGAGVGAVVLKDTLDPCVRGVQDLRQLVHVPPLVAIPVMLTQSERRTRRRILIFSIQGVLIAIAGTLLLVHLFVRPLDILWIQLLRRFGV